MPRQRQPLGRQLAVGTYGEMVLWDLADAVPALVLTDMPGPVHALAFSRDGRRLYALVSRDDQQVLHIVDPALGEVVETHDGFPAGWVLDGEYIERYRVDV